MSLVGDWLHFLYVLVGSLAAIFVAILVYAHRAEVYFWTMNAWYSMPVIGKLSALARSRINREEDGWLTSEKTLCSDYARFTRFMDRKAFDRTRTYLARAQDLGRSPLNPVMLFILFLLVGAEAFGFSYILADHLGTDMSEIARLYGTGALIIVICLVMLMLTHAAGSALYKNLLISRCEREQANFNQLIGKVDNKRPLFTTEIRLDDNQNTNGDGKEEWFTQCMNRIARDRNWLIVFAAVFAILALAVGQTAIRFYAAHKADIAEVAQPVAAMQMLDFDNLPLPDDVSRPQAQADSKAASELKQATAGENMAGFLMLAAIYLITQGLSIYTGFQYTFGGRESKKAYEATRGAATYEEYMAKYHHRIAIADAKLLALRQKLQRHGINFPIDFDHTFDDWLIRVRQAENLRGQDHEDIDARVEDAMAAMADMSKDDMMAYLDTLDDELFQAIERRMLADKAAQKPKPKRSTAEQARRTSAIANMVK